MSVTALCRLCLNLSSNGKNLYGENGQPNEVYDIAVKYFHPMFLSVDQDNHSTVICYKCWHHLSDFHNYQQAVFYAQRKLIDGQSQMNNIKQQYEEEDSISLDIKHEKYEEEDSMSLPDLELVGDYNYDDTAPQIENTFGQNNQHFNEEKFMPEVILSHCTEDIKQKRSDEIINLENDETNSDDLPMRKKPRKSQFEMDNYISQWRDQLECIICGTGVQNFTLLQDHFRYEHPSVECYITCCQRKFTTRSKIEEHARFHMDPTAFKCTKCGNKLSSEGSLYTHKRKCQPQTSQKYFTKTPVEEIDNFIALYKPNLKCDLCNQIVNNFTALRSHFRDVHQGKEFFVLCCERKFNSRSVFKEHVWLHMDPNAFTCKICEKIHSRFKCLQIHMSRVHSITLDNVRPDEIAQYSKLSFKNDGSLIS